MQSGLETDRRREAGLAKRERIGGKGRSQANREGEREIRAMVGRVKEKGVGRIVIRVMLTTICQNGNL